MNEENKKNEQPSEDEKLRKEKEIKVKRLREQIELERFKRSYFAYYDDIKISHREDW